MAYLGKSPSLGVRNRYYFTASGSETSISGALTGGTLTFSDGAYVDVMLNGVTLVAGTDYNTTTANTIAGLTALVASDVVEIIVYDVFSVFGGNMAADLKFGDNVKSIYGAGSDLQIYHDGTDSHIDVAGTLNIDGSGETLAKFIDDGAVELYHNNAKKIETTATGVDVTGVITGGTLEATADTSAGDNAAIGYTSAEGLILTGQGSTSDITLKNDADATVFTVPTGTDDILFPDSAKILMGNSSDLQLYHDGSNSYINETGDGDLYIRTSNEIRIQDGNQSNFLYAVEDGDLRLYHNGSEKLRTASTGVDITGAFTATAGSKITTADNTTQLTLESTDADANRGPQLDLHRNSGSPADDDALGYLRFLGDNSAGEVTEYARFEAYSKDVTNGTEDGQLDIATMTAGTLSTVASVVGKAVGIGTTSPRSELELASSAGGELTLKYIGNSGFAAIKTDGSNRILFCSNGTSFTERMRIDEYGRVIIGDTSASGNDQLTVYGYTVGSAQYGIQVRGNANGYTQYGMRFYDTYNTNLVGSITFNTSAVSYNTSSDYRLKTAVEYDWDATSRLKQLKPARFKWIVDGDDAVFVDGFLAHECGAVPEAVTGTKDAMMDEEYEVSPAETDADGNVTKEAVMGTRSVPDYQGIDQSKLVPLLCKTILELEARITALETA